MKGSTRKTVALVAGLLALLAWVGQAAAGPLPGALGVGTAGESDLNSFIVGAASDLTVDWMVIADPGGYPGFPYPGGSIIYLYQLENTTGSDVNLFTVTVPAGTVVGGGILAGDDLDAANAFHPLAHGVGAFPILGGEEEGLAFVPLAGVTITIDPTTVTWTFADMPLGTESQTLFFVALTPPVYGFAVAMDGPPPSPWGTGAPGGGDPVPVPAAIPEPGTLLLLGSSLLGVAAWTRRRGPKV